MIERTLNTTAGKISIKTPDRLNELTIGQLMKLQENPDIDDIEAISILSGIAMADLKNVIFIEDFKPLGDSILLLANQMAGLYHSEKVPRSVTFFYENSSKKISVRGNLSVEPAGAFMAAREIMAEEINAHIKQREENTTPEFFNPSLKACCQVLAHYFFCKVTGKRYDEYEAEEFCDEIKKLMVTEALPIAKHFFTCYPDLSKPKTSCLLRFRRFWRKEQAYNLLRNLNISTP